VTVAARAEAKAARIWVRDTGIGLDPEEVPALFEPYRRSNRQREGGLGLGLTLVQALVQAHGGTVTARSEGLEAGSEFSFTLPLAATAPAPKTRPPVDLPARRRVLVVDDQQDVADMFAVLLETLGQDVRAAYDGETALRSACEHRPRVAFLDVSMPGMSGTDLAQRLRQAIPANELTLVAITGHDRDHAGVQAGPFDHHLLKPVTEESLATLLNAMPVDTEA
jgi:CheY-like chemotaxis protein